MSQSTKSPPKRHAVLAVQHPDGYIEFYAERNIDVRLVRVPVAHTRQGEVLAEECARMMTPRRYADLWRRDYLRANAATVPLTAEAIADALFAHDTLAAINSVVDAKGAA